MKRDSPPEFEIDDDVDYDDPREMEWVYRISESALREVGYEDDDCDNGVIRHRKQRKRLD